MPKGRGLHGAPQLRPSWPPAPHPGSASPRPGLQHSHPAAGRWAPLCPRPGGQAPRGALLLGGCHGPALHAAAPAPCGQTQWQPATHLSAFPHQALMRPSTCPSLLWPHWWLLPHPPVHLGLCLFSSPRSPPFHALLACCPRACRSQ